MKKIRCCFFLLLPSILFAQENQADSLLALLKNTTADSTRISLLISLSKSYFNADPEKAIEYGQQAKDIAAKTPFKKDYALALKNLGIANYLQAKYVEAINYWQEAIVVFDSIGDKAGVANMYSNQGSVYFNQMDEAKSLELYLKALKIAEDIHDTIRIVTTLTNIGAVYLNKQETYNKALEYFLRALPISQASGDPYNLGLVTVNLGEIYYKMNDDSTALIYLNQSLKYYENTESVPYSLNYIGRVYVRQKKYEDAIKTHIKAFEISEKLDTKLDMTQSLIALAQAYYQNKNSKSAITSYLQALKIGQPLEFNAEVKDAYEGLANAYAKQTDFANAFKYQTLLLAIKDTIYNVNTSKKLNTLQFSFTLEKKESQIGLLTKDKEIQEQEIARQKLVRNGFVGGFAIVLLFAGIFFTQRNRISKEKKRSDELLLNILPEETAEELKATGTAKTKSFDSVSVLFTDFKNFTQASEKLSPEDLVQEINYCYSEFDKIVTKYGIEKIKTIGDAYMCAGGLPVTNITHPFDVIKAGIEMQQFIERNKKEREEKGLPFFELRLGIHTGPVVAGVVGTKKFAYDIWGDTVNTASRMESSGEIGKVNVSGATYELVKNKFTFIHRGKVKAKNKGEIDMYFVEEPI